MLILGMTASASLNAKYGGEENKNIKKSKKERLKIQLSGNVSAQTRDKTLMHFSLENSESNRSEREQEKISDHADTVDMRGFIPEFSTSTKLAEANTLLVGKNTMFKKVSTPQKVRESFCSVGLCHSRQGNL